ncbi:acyltransferase family protein [Paraburkholderia diazotrophica]|uniref:Peptidoglycan/LPS O-acetylase OafA/YrhL, contains acyltransferase and SGNH-hydrolase domains n=1 Tax=Paraburkholderia diazotrophica TaxID=667676 RepID=A0A1H7DRE5_9BURK|nr:acyltransferase [Paraburkholderia diazotrophica]SEK03944.1 Peptidoglycan/LPS O-acetylase OafA/YrhL, contains acyltransferase and SGNH-hydrolase domains [Paraburkholderia diazotrophica]
MRAQCGDEDALRLRYLDGLRGWAAVIVLFCHVFPFYLLRSTGPSADSARRLLEKGALAGYAEYALASLGIVFYRFFTDGLIPVYVFFVLSGYVLSVGYVHRRRGEMIADQALRRYIRLTLPIASACLIAYCLMKLGWMYNQRVSGPSGSDWMKEFYGWPATLVSLIRFSLFDVYFDYSHVHSYIFVLWTMQIEFFGSFLVFCTLALFGELGKRWLPYGIVFVVVCLIDRTLIPFLFGLFIAELHRRDDVRRMLARPASKIVASILLVAALFVPVLAFHFVPRSAWSSVGSVTAVAIVVSVMMFAPLQQVLSCRASKFVGKISFSLYLIHPLVICSFGSWYFLALYERLDRPILIASCAILTIALSVLCALLFEVVDTWGVKAARRFSGWVLHKPLRGPAMDRKPAHVDATPAGESIGLSE